MSSTRTSHRDSRGLQIRAGCLSMNTNLAFNMPERPPKSAWCQYLLPFVFVQDVRHSRGSRGPPPRQTSRALSWTVFCRRRLPRHLEYHHPTAFIPGRPEPCDVVTTLDLHGGPHEVRMVLTFDAMHSEEWTRRQTMGWQSEFGKLAAALKVARRARSRGPTAPAVRCVRASRRSVSAQRAATTGAGHHAPSSGSSSSVHRPRTGAFENVALVADSGSLAVRSPCF